MKLIEALRILKPSIDELLKKDKNKFVTIETASCGETRVIIGDINQIYSKSFRIVRGIGD